jgi:hypothetical protein
MSDLSLYKVDSWGSGYSYSKNDIVLYVYIVIININCGGSNNVQNSVYNQLKS